MLRILHLADLHLGWQPSFMPREQAEERRRRRDGLLSRAVDLALDPARQIGLVLIVGDLFETHCPEASLVAAAMAQLRRLEQAGVPVVTVPGNHDEITYPNSVYQTHRDDWPGILVTNPHPAHVARLEAQGETVHLYSLAYTGGITQTQPAISQFPRLDEPGIHLAAFHGTLGDSLGERSLPLDPAALGQAGYHYVALGHIHKPGEVRMGRGLAVYPGAVEGKGFDDPGTGQFTIAALEPGGVTLERVPAGVQPVVVHDLDVSAMADAAQVAEAVAALADREVIAGLADREVIPGLAGADAVVRVRLTGTAPELLDPEAIAAACAHRFFYLEVVDETDSLSPELLDRWAGERTILGEFIRRMRRRLDEEQDEGERAVLEEALRRGVQAMLRR